MGWRLDYLKPGELIIPLGLLAFAAPGIDYLNSILNTTTRWVVLFSLTLFLLVSRWRDISAVLRHSPFWAVVIYGLWGLMTFFWSEEPALSLLKALVFLWLATVMIVAGYSWVARQPQSRKLDFLGPFAVVSLLASLTGQIEENEDAGSVVYAGLTGNPNYLGFLLAVSSAWILWRIYLVGSQDKRRYFLYRVAFVVNLYFLLMSHSRASLLAFLCIFLGFLTGIGRIRKWLPILLGSLYIAYSYVPGVNEVVTRYIFKASTAHLEDVGGNLYYSRDQVWQYSYELAMKGGMAGGGYGVTIGEQFKGGVGSTISSGQYGREQGNSQLAVIEQTGWIGLGFYLILVLSILGACFKGLRGASAMPDRVAVGLLGGAVAGLLVQSLFEAWWVAPGAPESATFWMLIGAVLGVSGRIRAKRLMDEIS